MARPELTFDQKDTRLVEVMTKYGIPPVDIAAELRIDAKTLRKHFGEVIATAEAQLKMAVYTAIYRKARNGSFRAQLWVAKRMDKLDAEEGRRST